MGSEGTYSFTHTIEDALVVADWIRRSEVLERFHIDASNSFTLGHSVGGHTTINEVRNLP